MNLYWRSIFCASATRRYDAREIRMKRSAWLLIAAVLLLCSCGRARETAAPVLSAPPTISASETVPQNRDVHISVTEMLADSPMLEELCALFAQQTGYRAELSVNTDSVAVSVAETGKMDVLLAQQGTEASRFLAAGYAERSSDWLSSALVLAGPADDPAHTAEAQTAPQAFLRIAKTGSAFVSRYDDSDVNRLETRLWANAGVMIGNGKRWYKTARSSMTAALRQADALGAYILADRETFLRSADETQLVILLADVPELTVAFCLLPVSAERFPSVNAQGAQAWIDFLQSASTKSFLQSYGTDRYGSPIFKVLY